ncbi:MAG: hypothetical protein AAFR11_05745 [Pseudomonadota bacterium]
MGEPLWDFSDASETGFDYYRCAFGGDEVEFTLNPFAEDCIILKMDDDNRTSLWLTPRGARALADRLLKMADYVDGRRKGAVE